jgi:hypothetical protein
MKKIGLEVLTNAKAKGMTKNGKVATVEVEIAGETKKLEADWSGSGQPTTRTRPRRRA